MKSTKTTSKSIGAGLLVAITASLCCITPVLALLSGASGIAATFSWMDPFRPYLIVITIAILGFAWYQLLKPRSVEEIDCDCEDEKPSFWQSKKFLGLVTVFAGLMLAFPYYADAFYPETQLSESSSLSLEASYDIKISGMTCTSCEEHVKHEVSKLPGVSALEVSYVNGNALVTFNESMTDIESVKAAIGETGYKIEGIDKSK